MFRTIFCAAACAVAILAQSVPLEIQVPAGHTAFLKVQATGTQNYVCLPGPNGMAWKFQGPQATFFATYKFLGAEMKQQVGTHYLSPSAEETGTPARATWQSSLDTSAVWAKKIGESTDPAYVAQGAIPWFLLQVTGSVNGPMGGSMLSKATYIQRVNTAGGVAPSTACTEAGALAFVPYTTDYFFFRAATGQ